MTRPHCLSPDACAAAKPTTHCRSCLARRINADPELRRRRAEGIARHQARPGVKAAYRERMAEVSAAMWADPAYVERRRAHGKRQAATVLARPDVIDAGRAPDVRARATATREETLLGWCPPEWRDHYRYLNRTKRIPAAEARKMIEAEIPGTAEHARREIASYDLSQRLRAERERAEI